MERNIRQTIKASFVWRMEDGNIGGGTDFYWVGGAHTVLYQEWEHNASGNTYGPVTPDPMVGQDLIDYAYECWQGRDDHDYMFISVEVYN